MKRLALLLPLLLGGCYVFNQTVGHLSMMSRVREIEDVLADPATPAAVKDRLRLVAEIRDFGRQEIGLTPGNSYTSYFDTGGKPVSWGVSACAKDRFKPTTWWFPIVGTIPYKAYFSRDDAREEARALEAEGLDVAEFPVSAYSTLGWFRDPVLSTMLDDPPERLAALLLHEMTHATVWIPGGVDFNEGLAGFVGEQGAVEFARWRFGLRSPEYDRAVRAFASRESSDRRNREVYDRLDGLYRSGASFSRKIELRDAVAGRPVNNARLLGARRYGRLNHFRRIFDEANGDWQEFFRRARSGSR